MSDKKKALLLLSGGLDSVVALAMTRDHNIDVEAVHFTSLFCTCGAQAGRKDQDKGGGCGPASKAAEKAGIKLHIVSKGEDYIELIKTPVHGRGSNMNICIDCRIYSFKKAKELMEKIGASFIITGEVLGQRPMSQHKQALFLIEKEAGLKDLVLRPLSALGLPETIPEKEGWVDRAKLKKISGRSRNEQMTYAKEQDLTEHGCPAGGCLLTDPQFSRRLKDLIEDMPEFCGRDVALLKYGRHFRLGEKAKVIVGRNKNENEILESMPEEKEYLLYLLDYNGPTSILTGANAKRHLDKAAAITARYGDVPKEEKKVKVEVKQGKNIAIIETAPATEEETAGLLL